jgi:hypothetical protein
LDSRDQEPVLAIAVNPVKTSMSSTILPLSAD